MVWKLSKVGWLEGKRWRTMPSKRLFKVLCSKKEAARARATYTPPRRPVSRFDSPVFLIFFTLQFHPKNNQLCSFAAVESSFLCLLTRFSGDMMMMIEDYEKLIPFNCSCFHTQTTFYAQMGDWWRYVQPCSKDEHDCRSSACGHKVSENE